MKTCLKNAYNYFINGHQTIELRKTLRNGTIQFVAAESSKESVNSTKISCHVKIAFFLFVSCISFFVPSLLLTQPFYDMDSVILSNIILIVLLNNILTMMIYRSIFERKSTIFGLNGADICKERSRFFGKNAMCQFLIMMLILCIKIPTSRAFIRGLKIKYEDGLYHVGYPGDNYMVTLAKFHAYPCQDIINYPECVPFVEKFGQVFQFKKKDFTKFTKNANGTMRTMYTFHKIDTLWFYPIKVCHQSVSGSMQNAVYEIVGPKRYLSLEELKIIQKSTDSRSLFPLNITAFSYDELKEILGSDPDDNFYNGELYEFDNFKTACACREVNPNLDAAFSDFENLSVTIQNLEDDLKIVSSNITKLAVVLRAQSDEISRKNIEISTMNGVVVQLESTEEILQSSFENLSQIISNFTNNQSQLLADIEDLEETVNSQALELDELTDRSKEITKLNENLTKTLQGQVNLILGKDAEIDELEKRINDLELSVKNLTEFAERISTQNMEKARLIDRMTNEEEDMQNVLKNLSDEIILKENYISQVEAATQNLNATKKNLSIKKDELARKVLENDDQLKFQKTLTKKAMNSKKVVILEFISGFFVLSIALIATSLCLCRYVSSASGDTSRESSAPNAQQQANAQIHQNQPQQLANSYFGANAGNVMQNVRPKDRRYR